MLFEWLRDVRRRRILEQVRPPEWEATIGRDVPATRRLEAAERETLMDMVQVFVAEKNFDGAGGLEISERMQLVIAAQACLMILALDHDLYRRVLSIVVYPSTVYSPQVHGASDDEPVAILGEAHYRGPVILAWDSVRQGAYNPSDGRNVVYHEFAHKLDMLSGASNGAPPLERELGRVWTDVLGSAYQELQRDLKAGKRTFWGSYAATKPAEFFAVASERFFEQGAKMKARHEDVYRALSGFYRQDPARW